MPTSERPSPRRDQILQKALIYLLDHGVAGLSLRPLAKACGTSARLLVYHFGSREGLLTAAMEEIHARVQASFTAATAGTAASPLAAIWAWMSDPSNRPYMRLLVEVQALALQQPREYAGYLERTSAGWLAAVERAVGSSRDARVVATLCIAVIDGLVLELLSTGDRRRTTAALALFDTWLNRPRGRAR